MCIDVDVSIKLLDNELVFHLVNKHVVPLRVSGNVMDVPNNSLEVCTHGTSLSEKT